MDDHFDIIIIGSGLGGLLCANILGKNGYKVAVLEKNAVPGGCLQSFKRKRVSFDTGIHYVGSFGEGQRMHKLYKYLGAIDGFRLRQLDKNGFDRFMLGDKEVAYASGKENFIETLSQSFPNERKAINSFTHKIEEIAQSISLYNLKPMDGMERAFFDKIKYGNTWDYLTGISNNTSLHNALSGLNTLYAGKKAGSLLFVHALIYNHYIDGAYRFEDGTNHVTNQLIKTLESHGGKLFTQQEVTQFNFDGKNIKSVITKDSHEFFAKQFISGIHPQNTLRMIDPEKVRKTYRNRINNIQNTISSFTLYVILKDKTVPYMNHNQYIYPTGEVWKSTEYDAATWPEGCALYPLADRRDEKYTRGLSVLTMMPFSEFEKWSDTRVGMRGKDYEELKEEKAQQLISFLKKHMPVIGNNIESYYVSTPLTYRDYTGTPNGAIYGIERDSRRPLESFIFPKTKIPNLLFTGQNVMLHGMLGVSMGSLLTCSELIDINSVLKDINNV